MTAGGMCASESMLPPQGDAQGGAEGGAQGRGALLAQPLKSAAVAAAQTMQANIDAGTRPLTKAGILTQCLLEPAAVLAMLGLSAKEGEHSELQTQLQEMASMTQTQAGAQLSSAARPQAADSGKAAAAAGTEVAGAAAGHPHSHDLYLGANHSVQADQQQASGRNGCGGSLLTLLGLGTEGLGWGAVRVAPAGACVEEEAGLQVDRQAGIALHLVEALLNAALTQPEVSGFPLPPPPRPSPPSPHPICLAPSIPPPLYDATVCLCVD